MTDATLHSYFRSSASYRVRIALNLKRISYRYVSYHLRKGEQEKSAYLTLNPQGLVPSLQIDGVLLTQSLAICDYLEETHPTPALLPADPIRRARVRAFSQVIVCDTHPLQNLKILKRLGKFGVSEERIGDWASQAISEGLAACDRLISKENGPYCFGSQLSLADVCLVPQLMNARRFGVALHWPRLTSIESICKGLDEFIRAAPEHQADAE